ncbi:MAG: S-4TM family putative pore-forming effector [Crocinitomicaceae bacterium]|nr:S-4TM family putative pore-forming effector [Crocinitomicaceae bacterium]
MGGEIIELENRPQNIELLAAQKHLYIIAKRYFVLQIILTTFVVVTLAVIHFFKDIGEIISIYSVFIAFIEVLFLKVIINRYKEKAASIQEMFDIKVLSIGRNALIEQVDLEEVGRYAKLHKKIDPTYGKLKNWYSSSIKDINSPVAKIICQRSNCVYDFTLRRNYNISLSILLGALSLTVISLGAYKESSVPQFFIIGVLPVLPMFLLFIQLYKDNNDSNNTLNRVKLVANNSWTKVLNRDDIDVSVVSRQLQDRIYQNRVSSPLIFEWFYNIKRKKLEEEMYYSVDKLVQEYRER